RIGSKCALQASPKQAGADKKNEAQRYLRNQQRSAQRQTSMSSSGRAVLQRGGHIAPRGLQRWCNAEYHARAKREGDRIDHHAPVDVNADRGERESFGQRYA